MRRFSDQAAIRTAKARVRAHLYELRLFDDPILILRAQKKLLLWNLRYVRLALRPAAAITIPALLIATQLHALYGKRALLQDEATVVTVQLKRAATPDPVLTTTPGFRVESPSVRVTSLRQICWRVRAIANSDGVLRLEVPGEMVEAPIRAGPGLRYVSAACASSPLGWIRDGCRIRSNFAESLMIEYPDGAVSLAGIEAHWLLWFVLFWFGTMLLLRRRFRVTF
jgi:hypothetical protein